MLNIMPLSIECGVHSGQGDEGESEEEAELCRAEKGAGHTDSGQGRQPHHR